MCEPEYIGEDPEIDCAEFEDFPCPDDDDDGTAVTGGDALTKLSDLGECSWPASGTFEYSKGRGEVYFFGNTYAVTASGATLSCAFGSWTIFQRSDDVFRVGDEKAAVRFVPATGSPKARVITQA